jgi:hypothetical protein
VMDVLLPGKEVELDLSHGRPLHAPLSVGAHEVQAFAFLVVFCSIGYP